MHRLDGFVRDATISAVCFGVCRNSTGTLDTDKLFTGQRLDDTGLYFYNARYYDATIGRFLSPDIYVQDPTNPQSLNRYSYCVNNPLKYTDPSGHFLDFLWDIGSFFYDLWTCITDPGDASNWAALGADALCAIIPGATGGGALVRSADKISDATRAFNKGSDAIQLANRGGDAAQFANRGTDAANLTNRGSDALRSGDTAVSALRAGDNSQIHHFATNCNKKYTPKMERIAGDYGLSLNGNWNKAPIPGHAGRHAVAYHGWVLEKMSEAASIAGPGISNAGEFQRQFKALVVDPVTSNPEMLKGSFWEP